MLAGAALLLAVQGCGAPEEPAGTTGAQGGTAGLRVEGMGADAAVEICPEDVATRIRMPVYPGAVVVEDSGKAIREDDRGGCSYSIRYRVDALFHDVREWYERQTGRRAVSASLAGMRAAVVAAPAGKDGAVDSVMVTQKNGSRTVSITLNRFEPGKR